MTNDKSSDVREQEDLQIIFYQGKDDRKLKPGDQIEILAEYAWTPMNELSKSPRLSARYIKRVDE